MASVDVDEMSGAAAKIYKSIDKVVITRGVLDDDPIIWELHIFGKVLKIEAENLENQRAFRVKYLRAFNRPAPKLQTKDWETIVEVLADDKDKTTVIEQVEESENVYIARQVFENIRKMPIDTDIDCAITGRCLLQKDNMYVLLSQKVADIAKEMGFKFTPNQLSPAMVGLGLKTAGTSSISLKGKDYRVWEFYPKKFEGSFNSDTQNTNI